MPGSSPEGIRDGHRYYIGKSVYDVSDPTTPRNIGYLVSLNDFGATWAVQSNLLYRTSGTVLQVWNVENLARPAVVGQLDLKDVSFSKVIPASGRMYYLGNGTSTGAAIIGILDVSDPAHPVERGRYLGAANAQEFVVKGSHIYVAGMNGGLQIIDIASAPMLTRVRTVTGTAVSRVALGDAPLLIARDDNTGVNIFDITDPANPIKRSSIPRKRTISDELRFNEVVRGTTLFSYENGLVVAYSLADRTTPKRLGEIEIGRDMFIMALRFAGNMALMGESWVREFSQPQKGLVVMDFTDPLKPVRVTALETSGGVNNLEIMGQTAYVRGKAGALHIVDITDIRKPVMISTTLVPGDYSERLLPTGRRVYITSYRSLLIYDVSNPSKPVRRGTFSGINVKAESEQPILNFVASDALLVGSKAFGPTSEKDHTSQIYDASDPSRLIEKASVAGRPLLMLSNLLYTAMGERLHVFNITDPASPKLISNIARRSNQYSGVGRIEGDLLVTDTDIFDITDPTSPKLSPRRNTLRGDPEQLKDYTLRGNYVYWCHGYPGLIISEAVPGDSFVDEFSEQTSTNWMRWDPTASGAGRASFANVTDGYTVSAPGLEDLSRKVGIVRAGANMADVEAEVEVSNWLAGPDHRPIIALQVRGGVNLNSTGSWYTAFLSPGSLSQDDPSRSPFLPHLAIAKVAGTGSSNIVRCEFPEGSFQPTNRYILALHARGPNLKTCLYAVQQHGQRKLLAELYAHDAELKEGFIGVYSFDPSAGKPVQFTIHRFSATGTTSRPWLKWEANKVVWGAWSGEFVLESSGSLDGTFTPAQEATRTSQDGLIRFVEPKTSQPREFFRLKR
ncbi:MAG TPA: hypothetical protein VEH27_14480 [Methylomirabilota bacterium]|nr:hypothetical protein [Methylomirabilota bacterium]